MQMTQLEADVETQTRNRTAALAVGNCRDVQGLMALQSNLASAYLESAMRYGTTFAQLAQQTNVEIAKLLSSANDKLANLERQLKKAQGIGEVEHKAKAYRDSVVKAMNDLRADIDALETMLPADLWPVPTYAEMLFKF